MEEYESLGDCIKAIYKKASEYAIDGVKKDIGGPFGAGIIQKINDKYRILVVERNKVIRDNDPTCHAEINAIRKACTILNNKSLDDCILVTTGKSCPMCLSAAIWANIKVIYYSEEYDSAVIAGFRDEAIENYINKKDLSIISEVRIKDENTIKPFEEWNKKSDKSNY